MTRKTPSCERSAHQIITADRTMRKIGCMGSCKNNVILLHGKNGRTSDRGIVIRALNERSSNRLTIEHKLNRHVLAVSRHKYGPREDINAINRSGKCSRMSVVSVSNICNRVVVYDGMVSTWVALGCRHVSIERYHTLARCRDNSNFYLEKWNMLV